MATGSKTNRVYFRTNGSAPKNGVSGERVASVASAKDHVLENWFPINHAILEKVRANYFAGLYREDREQLLSDLMLDFSVFAHVLRLLPNRCGEEASINPATLVRNLSESELSSLLAPTEEHTGSHSFNGMVRAQASRVTHSIVSCTTAGLLAQRGRCDPVLAYSGAMLRQLGHNLIAWNYPRIFSRALSQIPGDRAALDEQLTKTLGFSPQRLVAQIANDWRLAPELKLVVGLEVPHAEFQRAGVNADKALETAQEISRLCEVGEAFAEVSDPEHFPQAAFKWGSVVEEISRSLGPSGVEVLSRHLDGLVGRYHGFAPTLFGEKLTMEGKLEKAGQIHAQKLMQNNPYAQRCPEGFQEALRRVYRCVLGNKVSTEALQRLVGDAIPKAGFGRGCVYLMDRTSGNLVPTLKIGPGALNRYRPQGSTLVGEHSSPVTEALYCTTPLRQENALLFGERVAYITGAFGNTEKQGVLYLELSADLQREPSEVSLTHFRAVAQALNECLALQKG